MRLFTAIDPSPAVQMRLEQLLETLRPSAPLRWSPPANLHVTLKFIGEWPEDNLDNLLPVLGTVTFPAPFEVRVSGLGFFPNAREPRIFWVGVQAAPELGKLAGSIDKALNSLGIPSEDREYSPHLTLARIPPKTSLKALESAIRELKKVDLGTFLTDRFFLYRSVPGPKGSVYSRLAEFPRAGNF